jgi:RNA polymerase sigma factor (sigma-70 family)
LRQLTKASLLQKERSDIEFEGIIREHELLIWKVCRIYTRADADASDLFQEIVIQLWKSYTNFRGESKFTTWLYRVAINTAISGLRKKKDFISSYEPARLPVHLPEPANGHQDEQMEEMYQAIGRLNEVEKAVVMLYLDDKSYEEMEDIMGMSQGNLRVKMNRIREKLRQLTKNK